MSHLDMRDVLVVEDGPEQRSLIQRWIFHEMAVEVRACHSGEDALRVLEQRPPSLLVCDLELPGIDGLEVIRQAQARSPEIRTLMLTANPNNERLRDAVHCKIDDFILKPLRRPDLLARVARLLWA
jgi:two-component system response regulator YesN